MKRFLSISLLIAVVFCIFAMTACANKPSEAEPQNAQSGPVATHPEGFEPYVKGNSEIIGLWREETAYEGYHMEWQFFGVESGKAQLHYVKVFDDGMSVRDVGYFNFDEEAATVEFYFASKHETETTTYTVSIDKETMTLTPAQGEAITLKRIK